MWMEHPPTLAGGSDGWQREDRYGEETAICLRESHTGLGLVRVCSLKDCGVCSAELRTISGRTRGRGPGRSMMCTRSRSGRGEAGTQSESE